MRTHATENSSEGFSLGFRLAALVSALREVEADIRVFERYRMIVSRISGLEKQVAYSPALEKIFKVTIQSIIELNSWMLQKSNMYFPVAESIVREVIESPHNEEESVKIMVGNIREALDEKEALGFLAHVARTNTILNLRLRNDLGLNEEQIQDLHSLAVKATKSFMNSSSERMKSMYALLYKSLREDYESED